MTDKTMDSEAVMVRIREIIGEIPSGYTLSVRSGWIRLSRGVDCWDRPGIEFSLAVTRTHPSALFVSARVDLPTFLEANAMAQDLIRDLQYYSRVWDRVGTMAEGLKITVAEP